jgi:hypothetical protein
MLLKKCAVLTLMVMSASRGKDGIREDVSPDPDQCVPKRLFLDHATLVFSAPWTILMSEVPGPHTRAADKHNRHSQKVEFHRPPCRPSWETKVLLT